jgi:TonB family protein
MPSRTPIPRPLAVFAVCGGLSCGLMALAQARFVPARYVDGSLPQIPAQATGGGEVLLAVEVGSDGRVAGIKPLRVTPPFTDTMTQALRTWTFSPAVEQSARAASHVLVAGEYRPPTINTPTLGEAPQDVAAAPDDIPFPTMTAQPRYPPLARDNGVVLVEARVDVRGRVADAAAIRSRPPFDEAALEAMRRWTFVPARIAGSPVESIIYVFFGFRQPVTTPAAPPGNVR